jgi:hypothetical protein
VEIVHDRASTRNRKPNSPSSRERDLRRDWKRIAVEAWQVPSWREAALEYHQNRPPVPAKYLNISISGPSQTKIWRAAGKCVSGKAPHDALRTFLKWCDQHNVRRGDALPIFKTLVDKELAK